MVKDKVLARGVGVTQTSRTYRQVQLRKIVEAKDTVENGRTKGNILTYLFQAGSAKSFCIYSARQDQIQRC